MVYLTTLTFKDEIIYQFAGNLSHSVTVSYKLVITAALRHCSDNFGVVLKLLVFS